MSRGITRERQLRTLLEEDGWYVTRAAGSLGDADLVALRNGEIRLIEVKSTHRGPFHSFGPASRQELAAAARVAGGTAWLVWWPTRRQPVWISEGDWPRFKAAA